MLFSPSTCASLWDVSLFWEGGTHYLFYLASTSLDQPWDCIGLATSDDGVHFEDHGPIIEKAQDAEWLGGGMTWKCGGRYLLNFSECRGGRQAIYFAESDDLRHWARVPAEESTCRLDPRWYADGTTFSDQRWDGIWVTEREGSTGYFGYLTAVCQEGPEGLRGTAASVVSDDGLHFEAGPPVVAPGTWGDKLEVGAVAKLGHYYYMLAAQAEIPLGLRWTAAVPQCAGGVYVLRSDSQAGPFTLDGAQPPLLVSSPAHYTYFARFYNSAGETLVCHHSISPAQDIANTRPKAGSSFAPLKKALVDNGVLRLAWWPGNEALFGPELPLDLTSLACRGLLGPPAVEDCALDLQAAAGGIAVLPQCYDLERGVVIEGTVQAQSAHGRLFGAGLFIESGQSWSGTVLLADSAGSVSTGRYKGYAFKAEDVKVSPARELSARTAWRLLLRDRFTELYIEDDLVQCYTLPGRPSGRVGFVVESCQASFEDLVIRQMQL